jgi:HTH-type transcriptional regulator/antitoxin HigA
MNTVAKQAIEHWAYVAPLLMPPVDDAAFESLVATLDELLEITGDDESHPMMGLVHYVGDLVSAYEQVHYQMPEGDGRNALAFLMQQHSLTQSDLPDVGPQSVISDILNGKRQLNANHIRALCKRFNVSADTFL